MIEPFLIIPDTHRPFHHVKAYDLMLEVAAYNRPKHIYILGDYADFYSVMSHDRDPRVVTMITDEVMNVLNGLDELDKLFPEAKKVFIQGNHEYRLERYLMKNAPALLGTTSTEHILELHERPNWKYVPYGPNQSVSVAGSYLIARHEPLAPTAKGTAAKALCSLVYGHIHRIEESHIVGLDGKNHVCFSVGWLGDKRKDMIYGYVKNHHQWQMGFGIGVVDTSTRYFYHDKVHILENGRSLSCIANGKIFKNG